MAVDIIDDSLEAHISPDSGDDPTTRMVLLAAWSRSLSDIKPLLNEPGRASAQDPKTGETPLHAVVRGCGPAPQKKAAAPSKANGNNSGTDESRDVGEDEDEDEEDPEDALKIEEASEVMRELFMSGAIWNDVDGRDETPGCVAWRLGRKELYELCVQAGERAEMLFGLLGGYEELSSGGDEDMDDAEEIEGTEEAAEGNEKKDGEDDEAPQLQVTSQDAESQEKDTSAFTEQEQKPAEDPNAMTIDEVTSERYLNSDLTFDADKLLDADLNGVMMSWETPIMERTVAMLLPKDPPSQGKRILNIGFGMGIVDRLFAETSPSRHHIIEAHPAVLARLNNTKEGINGFNKDWEASGPSEGAFKIHAGRWQDVVPQLLNEGEVYDVVYFDTFGEDYSQLRHFFMELLPGILDMEGRFSYFNGCGADRRICYDVYTRVAESHLGEAGMDVEWTTMDVDMDKMRAEGEGEWEGVKRRYWTLEKYKLPICTWMG